MTDDHIIEAMARAICDAEGTAPPDAEFEPGEPHWRSYMPAARAALAAYRQAAWRPISEAPRDGTVVLLWSSDEGFDTGNYVPADKMAFEGGAYWQNTYGSMLDNPTHFQPLPPPPEDKG